MLRSLASLAMAAFGCLAWASIEVPAARLVSAPTIDGLIDPSEWKDATHAVSFVDPYTGKPAPDQTEAWIGYDSNAIYIAIYAHDSEPNGIVGREIKPGAEFDGEDELIFRVNTFGTQNWESMSRFSVNPLNTQSEEIAGGHAAKREWRGEWQSAVKRVPDGWTAEMRIPWKILNYPSGKDLRMDVNFIRYQARTKIRSMWQNETPAFRAENMARWVNVNPPAKANPKPWEVMAYAAPEYDEGRTGLRSGLDARYKMSPTMTALMSINPDFRNIENEIAGIDFTRTERFFEDPRPFFTEGGSYFDLTGEFTFGRMFYSRRIQACDVGAKAFGKITPSLSTGLLTTLDNGRSSASVARVGQQFGPYTDVSLYATELTEPGRHNTASGVSAYHRFGNFWADTQLAMEKSPGRSAETAGAMGFAYEAPKWFALLRGEFVRPGFNPALAYIPWTDRKGYYLFTNYNNEIRSGPIREMGGDLFVPQFATYAGLTQEKGYDAGFGITTASDIRLRVGSHRVEYPDGLDDSKSFSFTLNNSNRYKRFGGFFSRGTRDGSASQFTDLNGSYRLFKGFDVGFDLAEQRYLGTDRLAILTLGYEISATQSVTGRFVARNGRRNAYLAYRNGGGSGTEYYLILGDPNSDTTRARVSVKVVWAF